MLIFRVSLLLIFVGRNETRLTQYSRYYSGDMGCVLLLDT